MAFSLRHAFAAAIGTAVLTAVLAVTVTSWGETLWGVASSGPVVGEVPAEFSLPIVANGDGALTLAETRGTPVVIEVFASWCKYCDRASATVAEASRARRRQPVRFVGVSLDEHASQAHAVASEWRLPYPVVHDDGSFTQAWNISALPTVIVVDADGRVRHVMDEAPTADRLERSLRSVGAGRSRW